MPDINRVRTNSPRYPPPSTQSPNAPELRPNPPYTLPIILPPQIRPANRSNNSPIMNPPTPSVNSLELVNNIPVPVEPFRTNPVPENISSPSSTTSTLSPTSPQDSDTSNESLVTNNNRSSPPPIISSPVTSPSGSPLSLPHTPPGDYDPGENLHGVVLERLYPPTTLYMDNVRAGIPPSTFHISPAPPPPPLPPVVLPPTTRPPDPAVRNLDINQELFSTPLLELERTLSLATEALTTPPPPLSTNSINMQPHLYTSTSAPSTSKDSHSCSNTLTSLRYSIILNPLRDLSPPPPPKHRKKCNICHTVPQVIFLLTFSVHIIHIIHAHLAYYNNQSTKPNFCILFWNFN